MSSLKCLEHTGFELVAKFERFEESLAFIDANMASGSPVVEQAFVFVVGENHCLTETSCVE